MAGFGENQERRSVSPSGSVRSRMSGDDLNRRYQAMLNYNRGKLEEEILSTGRPKRGLDPDPECESDGRAVKRVANKLWGNPDTGRPWEDDDIAIQKQHYEESPASPPIFSSRASSEEIEERSPKKWETLSRADINEVRSIVVYYRGKYLEKAEKYSKKDYGSQIAANDSIIRALDVIFEEMIKRQGSKERLYTKDNKPEWEKGTHPPKDPNRALEKAIRLLKNYKGTDQSRYHDIGNELEKKMEKRIAHILNRNRGKS